MVFRYENRRPTLATLYELHARPLLPPQMAHPSSPLRDRKRGLIYLASPLGFSQTARELVLPRFVDALSALGLDVYEPFGRNAQNGLGPGSGSSTWAFDISYADRDAVLECDAIFAIVNGLPPDEGVAVELGVAAAARKPTFLFRDDFRKAADSEDLQVNLMLYCGLPADDWRRFVYSTLDELADPDKALAAWAASAANGRAARIETALDAIQRAAKRGPEGRAARVREALDAIQARQTLGVIQSRQQTDEQLRRKVRGEEGGVSTGGSDGGPGGGPGGGPDDALALFESNRSPRSRSARSRSPDRSRLGEDRGSPGPRALPGPPASRSTAAHGSAAPRGPLGTRMAVDEDVRATADIVFDAFSSSTPPGVYSDTASSYSHTLALMRVALKSPTAIVVVAVRGGNGNASETVDPTIVPSSSFSSSSLRAPPPTSFSETIVGVVVVDASNCPVFGIGPIAVDTRCQGGGVGKLLMEEAAAAASKYMQARPDKGGQSEDSLSMRLVVDAWNVAVRVFRMTLRNKIYSRFYK